MPRVDRRPNLTRPRSLLTSWLAGLVGIPFTLLLAAAGQGLGTLAVGGAWIGICLPWDRQVWALVNQPALSFSASIAASGYWLGPWLAPLAVASIVPLTRFLRSLGSQIVAIQLGWSALTIGAGWSALLEGTDGQIARWLQFRALPVELRWAVLFASIIVVFPMVIRLLSIDRVVHYHAGRGRRIGLVMTHLWPATILWIALFVAIHKTLPVASCIGAALPLIVGLLVAWFGFPPPPTHAMTPVRGWTPAALAIVLAAMLALLVAAGRPLPDDRYAAVQWLADTPTNNVREWMTPWPAPWIDRFAAP
jgi:hypothetical protein